jgi:choline dehydrogenase
MALRPHSRGSVRLRSADPADAPLLDPAYLSDEGGRDLRTAIAGVRRAQEILRQPIFAKWRSEPLTDGAMSPDNAGIARYVRRTGLGIHHLVSTCRMGREPEAALDGRCRVRGVRGLRVVDASALPTMVSAHTHGPVTMLAERASELIIADQDW